MASLTITTRRAKDGSRYVVRYRLGGRAWPIVHTGSFRTLKEARKRRDLVAGEIAAGRNPADVLQAMVDKPQMRTFGQWADAYQASRVDIAEQTKIGISAHLKLIAETFKDRNPATITTAEVQEWIGSLTLKPSSVRRYVATLRAVLDFAGVDPKPRPRRPRQVPAPGAAAR